jgi:hypothetical protein
LTEFVTENAGLLVGFSLTTLAMTFILLPFMIVRLPEDYFLESHRPLRLSRFLIVRLLIMALKNVIGLGFVFLGILMLFVPGQGILTIVVGLTIMNYPGKFKLERWLVMRPRVLPALNWLRKRYGHPPLQDPVKLKNLVADWPPANWTRGSLTWDEDPGMLKLAAVSEPGAAGTFELVAADAQLCRWSSTLTINDPAQSTTVSETLNQAIGKRLDEVGEL